MKPTRHEAIPVREKFEIIKTIYFGEALGA